MRSRNRLTLDEHLISPPVFCWDLYCSFCLVFWVVLLCVFTFWVLCCDVRYDFRIITMFSSFLHPVVCRRTHVLFTLFLFACIVMSNTYCVVFLFCFSSSYVSYVASFSGLPFLIAPSVFSNIYLSCVLCTLCCQFLWIGLSFFDCPFILCTLCCQFLWIVIF